MIYQWSALPHYFYSMYFQYNQSRHWCVTFLGSRHNKSLFICKLPGPARCYKLQVAPEPIILVQNKAHSNMVLSNLQTLHLYIRHHNKSWWNTMLYFILVLIAVNIFWAIWSRSYFSDVAMRNISLFQLYGLFKNLLFLDCSTRSLFFNIWNANVE